MSFSAKQNAWNFASIIIYIAALAALGYYLNAQEFELSMLTPIDIAALILGTYRLTRIVVFEKIFKFFRDFVKNYKQYVLVNILKSIITCPWCASIWIALIVFALFTSVPYGKILIYLLAISGIASYLVLLANYLSLSVTEKQKRNKAE